ncbi:MAG: hypothetical protein TE42_08225 [Candidatus Synechococcus spongiarum SP3]|uniref:Uncharacterized protein n=1 Tax=Candidatus Synechococcus spongiarum SP3 TaxID=1604020 RepID=A0A0G2IVT4_9SYNE|nr:MAG: hypothetical protein TE42_08225 [Candidatus Synechococcus spongiarum SP3]
MNILSLRRIIFYEICNISRQKINDFRHWIDKFIMFSEYLELANVKNYSMFDTFTFFAIHIFF